MVRRNVFTSMLIFLQKCQKCQISVIYENLKYLIQYMTVCYNHAITSPLWTRKQLQYFIYNLKTFHTVFFCFIWQIIFKEKPLQTWAKAIIWAKKLAAVISELDHDGEFTGEFNVK